VRVCSPAFNVFLANNGYLYDIQNSNFFVKAHASRRQVLEVDAVVGRECKLTAASPRHGEVSSTFDYCQSMHLSLRRDSFGGAVQQLLGAATVCVNRIWAAQRWLYFTLRQNASDPLDFSLRQRCGPGPRHSRRGLPLAQVFESCFGC